MWEHWIDEEINIANNTLEQAEFLIKRDNLRIKNRKREVVYKRYYLYYKLHKDGHSISSIGRLFKKHHATIIHGIKAYEMIKRYKDVKQLLNEYKQIMK